MKRKFLLNKPNLGLWTVINSPISCEIAGIAGADFQILDMEHGTFDLATLDNCIRACEISDCAPFVRVPNFISTFIQSALDLGAYGIIVPQVQCAADCLEIVKRVYFPPDGKRGYNPFVRAGLYASANSSKLYSEFPIIGVILENQKAFNDIDAILAIKEIELIYLGVYDLSTDLGIQGQVSHPDIQAIINTSIEKILLSGKTVGLMVKSKADIQYYLLQGVKFLVYGVDSQIYHHAIKNNKEIFLAEVKIMDQYNFQKGVS